MVTGIAAYYILSSASVVASIIMSGVGGIPNNGIFRNKIGVIARKYQTLINPAGYAFSIWGVIYLFQIAMMIYYLSTLFRTNALGPVYTNPVILPASFHIFYTIANLSNIAWLFAFDREKILTAAFCLLILFVFGNAALFTNMKLTLDNRSQMEKYSKADLTATYILVQNGLDMYFAWVLCALSVNIAMVLEYSTKLGLYLTEELAATLSLSILLIIIIIFGVLDVTLGFEAGRHVFSGYFAFIWALVAILANNKFDITDRHVIMELSGIVVVMTFLFVKIVLISTTPQTDVLNNKISG